MDNENNSIIVKNSKSAINFKNGVEWLVSEGEVQFRESSRYVLKTEFLECLLDLDVDEDDKSFSQGASYKQVAKIGYLVGFTKEQRWCFYRLAEIMPLTKAMANHLIKEYIAFDGISYETESFYTTFDEQMNAALEDADNDVHPDDTKINGEKAGDQEACYLDVIFNITDSGDSITGQDLEDMFPTHSPSRVGSVTGRMHRKGFIVKEGCGRSSTITLLDRVRNVIGSYGLDSLCYSGSRWRDEMFGGWINE